MRNSSACGMNCYAYALITYRDGLEFIEIAGDLGYTTVDVQLSGSGNDSTISAIRSLVCRW